MDDKFLKTKDTEIIVKQLVIGIECIAWLYNCILVRVRSGALSEKQLDDFGYWKLSHGDHVQHTKQRELSLNQYNHITGKLIDAYQQKTRLKL